MTAAELRFIPAGAGNIARGLMQFMPATVHPRRCGEHPAKINGNMLFSGSSPQVRGTFVNNQQNFL